MFSVVPMLLVKSYIFYIRFYIIANICKIVNVSKECLQWMKIAFEQGANFVYWNNCIQSENRFDTASEFINKLLINMPDSGYHIRYHIRYHI